jgi:glycerol-3-phosphate dehydrogenase
MGEDVVDKALLMGGLPDKKSVTERMPIHGYLKNFNEKDHLHYYGADAVRIRELIATHKELGKPLTDNFKYVKAEVIWAVRNEMARTVEDFLARRIRLLLLDAKSSIKAAHTVAELMAVELGKDESWIEEQTKQYSKLALEYIL